MNVKIIRKDNTVTNVPATIGDIVFDRRINRLYLEVVTANRTFKVGLVPMENDFIVPPGSGD